MTLRAWFGLASIAAIAMLLVSIYWKGRSHGVEDERHKAEVAQTQAATAMVEVDLARRAAARTDMFVRRQTGGAELARQHSIEAMNAKDADKPLADERAARLRTADRQLCELSPGLVGCASTR